MTKTIEDHFSDWEQHVFGFGYGSGEIFVLSALKQFLNLCRENEQGFVTYDHKSLEGFLGGATTWLLINTLCKHDIIEYGTSPRFGWLTSEGQRLRKFLLNNPLNKLVELSNRDCEYAACSPDSCNCGPQGWSDKKLCHNPFWVERGV